MKTITERIAEPELIIIDGGTGTEMEKRGARMEEKGWSASSSLTEPQLLRQIHQDYIDAGAEVIITNTYACSKHVMAQCGLEERFEEVNAASAKIACEVRDSQKAEHQVWVAGSLSPDTFSTEKPNSKESIQNFTEQANILAENGVDFFVFEMVWDVENATYLIEAVKQTGLPYVVGFTARLNEDKQASLVGGKPFGEILPHLDLSSAPMIMVMHSLVEAILPALADLQTAWSGPTGVYAHYGKFEMPNWVFNDMISPTAYADEVEKWIDTGVSLVGGCCGIGPEHIGEMTRRFR